MTRRVHRLRMNAPNEAQLANGRMIIEDALRTASLDEGSQRLFIIRRLRLAMLSRNATRTTVSRRLEQDVKRLQSLAVHWENANAATAIAIYFRSPLEACIALARRLASGGDVGAWFWPLAVPGYRLGTSRDEALRAVLLATSDLQPQALSVAALIGDLAHRGELSPLLSALRDIDASVLFACCESDTRTDSITDRNDDASAPHPQQSLTNYALLGRALASAMPLWPVTDVRLVWIAAMLLVAERPNRLADSQLLPTARRWIATVCGETLRNETFSARNTNFSTEPGRPPASTLSHRRPVLITRHAEHELPMESSVTVATASDAIVPNVAMEPRAISHTSTSEGDNQSSLTQFLDSSFSHHAGLLFVLNAAARLGMGDWLTANPDWLEWGFVPRWLHRLACRLRVPEDDPVLGALYHARSQTPSPSRGGLGWGWGSRSIDGFRIRSTHPTSGTIDDGLALIDAWINATRLWCRRHAGVSLTHIVRRDGYVRVTPTHVDVSFDLSSTELCLRRVGLDLDPGWVPWLGRVVRFHYDRLQHKSEPGRGCALNAPLPQAGEGQGGEGVDSTY